jgi:uncharacterized protein (TIGR02001 family)
MKLRHGLAAMGLTFAAMSAQAEITGNVGVFSDYNWRGISQTSQDPAIQGGVDYAHDSGFYAGVWASNVDFGPGSDANIETDLYLGFGGGETVTWDVGGIYYLYPEESDFNFWEIYAGLGWNWLSTKLSWTNDFANLDESAFYLEANAGYELPANFGLTAHVGYSDGDGVEASYGQDNYFDWAIGVTYTLGHFDLGLKYADGSDLETLDGTLPDDLLNSEGVAIFSITTEFPWSNE